MKKLLAVVAVLAVVFGAARLLKADGNSSAGARFEYRHLLILMDRNLDSYEKSDSTILAPLQRAGEEGWEVVSANEPANGPLVNRRAAVEFFLKRAK